MKYQEVLEWMYQQLPIYTRIGTLAYKTDLENIRILCEQLDNPHQKFKSVHIAGTNGKGSCSNMLANAFQKAGYKTGLYTSPHLFDFRERIQINADKISKDHVIDFIENHNQLIEYVKPSFFEMTVAMAFDYFAKQNIDIAIVEVGLGGLLDSTNLITPEISIITNISKDHTNLLGNSIEEIATQKAGIIKQNTPVLIGETDSQTEKIFITKAIQHNSPLFFADQRYELAFQSFNYPTQTFKIVDKSEMEIINVHTDLLGEYQWKNCITVLNAIEILKTRQWDLSNIDYETVFQDAKKNLTFKGRFDIMSSNPTIILDVSHNEAGVKELISQVLKQLKGKLHIVMGFVEDKDIESILKIFPKQAQYYFVNAEIPRAKKAKDLMSEAQEQQLVGDAYPLIKEGIKQAISQAENDDTILITGSFFIMEAAYQYLEQNL
ncbi:MAG: bifunctional folylpolyglutamate synthase/dihydrofolate synthase [Chitinophagaceae bacterium]|nr:bifunctional folylpolyglutamate synthase/dihydrofolate synthase [Chitinophagaceae bacterium]